MKITALVTARGNNTLEHKHLIKINNKEVISYPLDILLGINKIDFKVISSDDDKILELARNRGFNNIKRPENISKPDLVNFTTDNFNKLFFN